MQELSEYLKDIQIYLNSFSEYGIVKIAIALMVFFIFLFLRKLFSLVVIKSIKKFTSKTKSDLDDKLIKIFSEPMKFLFIIFGLSAFFSILEVKTTFSQNLLKSLFTFVLFWIFYGSIELIKEPVFKFGKKFGSDLSKEIANFSLKIIKIFVISVAIVSILQIWGINVSAFIASLGLGGLAFALAAKDTAANLFGSLAILADKAIKTGEWIKVNGVEGIVEDIGMRTTKIRTFEKSLITMPNQIIANSPIENFSRRGIRRIKTRIGLDYNTTNEQLKKIIHDIKSMLKSHPDISQDSTILVNFDRFEDSSLSLFLYYFANTANWKRYLEIKEDTYLKIIKIVQKHGSSFAFPTQTIYLHNESK